jgi:hypothetical protein
MKLSLACLLSLASSATFIVGCGSNNDSTAPAADTAVVANPDTGKSDAASVAPKCISIADDLIADFSKDNGLNPADGRQGGFYLYGDDNGTFDPPKVGNDAYPIDSANGNPACSGPGSFHTKASGFSSWGAAMGTDFMPTSGDFKGTYDASKYKGVSFWAKAGSALKGVQVSFPDIYTDAKGNPNALDSTLYPCAYIPGATNNCSPYLVKLGDPNFSNYTDYKIDTEWKRFDIYFADTKQDQYNPGFHTEADHLDTSHLTGMAIQVNADYSTGKAAANDFELWIDDVNFIK